MKKILIVLTALSLSLTACADQPHVMSFSELPIHAQTFISKYFNSSDISYIERDRDGMHYEYDVHLKNMTEIDFDYRGNLQSIDCQHQPVPGGIVPELIVNFVKLHYPNHFIEEYAIEHRQLKIELNNEIELYFDLEGNFIYIDD